MCPGRCTSRKRTTGRGGLGPGLKDIHRHQTRGKVMFAQICLLAARESRGARFFRALGEGSWFAWAFLLVGIAGLIMMCVEHYRRKNLSRCETPSPSPSASEL